MRFAYKQKCQCGSEIIFLATGEAEFEPVNCASCNRAAVLFDPLSVSVTAERLLYRSKAELELGDFSLSVVIATMAVESYLTRLFLKFKDMENYAATFQVPDKNLEDEWESEYPRSGGFLKPSDFVSKKLTDKTFDQFIMSNNIVAAQAFLGLPNPNGAPPSRYFQDELFKRRNRIAHWGDVNTSKEVAENCYQIAVAIVTILREMDRLKYANL
jgi:hypothetical protein